MGADDDRIRTDRSLFGCLMIVALSLLICLQVEVMKARAGGVLPNRQGGRIHYSMADSETGWRLSFGIGRSRLDAFCLPLNS